MLVPMERQNIPEVLDIESVSFASPWREKDFVYALEDENGISRVVRIGDMVLGYVVGFMKASEFHLADFAVRPDCQRRGYGTAILEKLLTEVAGLEAQAVTLEVRQSNQPAVRMYSKSGFQTIAMRKAYYRRPVEDALVMVRPLRGKLSDWVVQHAQADP